MPSNNKNSGQACTVCGKSKGGSGASLCACNVGPGALPATKATAHRVLNALSQHSELNPKVNPNIRFSPAETKKMVELFESKKLLIDVDVKAGLLTVSVSDKVALTKEDSKLASKHMDVLLSVFEQFKQGNHLGSDQCETQLDRDAKTGRYTRLVIKMQEPYGSQFIQQLVSMQLLPKQSMKLTSQASAEPHQSGREPDNKHTHPRGMRR